MDQRIVCVACRSSTRKRGAGNEYASRIDAAMSEFKLGATEEFSCKAKDGNEAHRLIVKPADYEPGKK